MDTGRSRIKAEVLSSRHLVESDIKNSFPKEISGGSIPGNNYYEYGVSLTNQKIDFKISDNGSINSVRWEKKEPLPQALSYTQKMLSHIKSPLYGKQFRRINAERDISVEKSNNDLHVHENGIGATNLIKQIVYKANLNSNIVWIELLTELNKIINPDIHFEGIHPQDNGNDVFEIYFANSNKELIPLSKMGSGVKTILLVLLQLIIFTRD